MIDFEFRGGQYRLYFNGLALFAFYDKFGKDASIFDVLAKDGKDGYEAVIWTLCELSKQGELYARFLGMTPQKPLEYLKTIATAQPVDYVDIKKAVVQAVTDGFRREHPDPELAEDPWLAEIESKKKQRLTGRCITEQFRRVWACLSGKE